ncbi:MAG TPA: hypothetical protein VNN80_02740 [Polyangiaceae bacterium]|nr:hypothetical protein [Polyangiaceae bacterium]
MPHSPTSKTSALVSSALVSSALCAAFIACSDEAPPIFSDGQSGSGGQTPPTPSAAAGANGDDLGGQGGAPPGGGDTPASIGDEGNPVPTGISGVAGSGSGGPAATGGAGSGGAGPAQPIDCDALPAASPLVGWAAVEGRGVSTTTGGGDATPLVVSTLAELQDALEGDEPRVILVRGALEPGDIDVGSNKTIVGTCGAEIHGHLELSEISNVIIRNLTIVGYGAGDCALDPDFDAGEGCSSGADAISVQRDTHHVWFDHCAVRDGTDGNLDITNGADLVTVSWTKFSYTPRTDELGSDSTGAAGHRFSNLIGGTDEPDDFDDANALNVTWHHNWWADNVVERQPRVRFGRNHLFNNYWDSATANYCVRAGIQARILLEGNVFEGVDDPHEFNNADDQLTANITAGDSNLYIATTSDQATGGGGPAFGAAPYAYALEDAALVAEAVQLGAGPR